MKRNLRIAVADDENDMRDYLRTVLPLGGHEVIGAVANGEALVELCVAEHPDLAIIDIKMPEMDGLDAARIIGSHWAMPFIVISGYYDADLMNRAQSYNVMAYLVKPIKHPDLETALPLAMHRFQ
jgi:response regulator NasT